MARLAIWIVYMTTMRSRQLRAPVTPRLVSFEPTRPSTTMQATKLLATKLTAAALLTATLFTAALLTVGCKSAQSSPVPNLPAPPSSNAPSSNAPSSNVPSSNVPSTAALPAATRLASASPNALTIATWNLEWLAESDGDGPIARDAAAFTRLGKYAARLNADVIAVQEVASVAALARVFDPTRYAFHVTADSTPQRTGFVYDKRLVVRIHPDYTELNTGSLRSGADLAVYWNGKWVRLLSVHLKSGCFAQPMTHGDACTKLKAQIPRLEAWVDARANEQTPFAVLGDFNRRLFAANDDSVWRALDDNQPPESDLFSPTQGERSGCWKSQHAKYIDHIVLSRSLTAHFSPGSLAQQLYDASDAPYRKQLSDHCPIALRLSTQLPPLPPLPPAATAHATTSPVTSSALPSAPVLTLVKGNRTRKGKLYYHTIDCPQYTRVKVDDTKGEQSFADEVSARAAGYLRSPDCPKR